MYSRSFFEKLQLLAIVVGLLIVVFILAFEVVIQPLWEISDARTVTVTVTDKGIQKNSSSGSDEYLIYCKTVGGEVLVLRNEDSLLNGKFNSSDVYAQIQVGAKYKFRICGPRVPILSMYPNIIGLEKVS